MKTYNQTQLVWLVVIVGLLACPGDADARGGRGGGGRPSMGRVGGGGGRPSMGHAGGGFNRPAAPPQMARPNVQRPSMGQAARPNVPTRPPSGFHPGGGGRPNLSRPTTPGGSNANRPNIRPPSNVQPTRPSLPGGNLAGGNRPNLGNRPGTADRPTLGNRPGVPSGPDLANRPGANVRPSLPGNRPGVGDRPSLANVNRPTTLPGTIDRPGIGGNRPGVGGDRPGIPGNRPGIGGNRPEIGNRPGAGDRPIIGGGNINIGNNVNIGGGNVIGNRPNWDRPNWNNPDWGWGGGRWADNWHDHCIRPHYGWYNGCWTGYWGSNWYAPLAWGAVGWGLGSWANNWGYGTSYYNPYYAEPTSAATVPYDYSQPVAVDSYDTTDATGSEAAAPTELATDPAAAQATALFDEGLALFKSADYNGALAKFDSALQKLPGDPVIHEVRALTLFALGEYKPAAAALNSLLSSAPGMDWTTMSSLYGNPDDYKEQLRTLEHYCQANPQDASAHFVLAYQYLVIGSQDAAVNALKVVVANEPQDYTAHRMLDALSPSAEPAPTATAATPAGQDAPQTDLVGEWRAKAGDTTIELTITEDSKFTWKATQAGKPATELNGDLASTSDELVLQIADQGAMAGSVKSLGPDRWQFALSGAPPSEPGLSFDRVKS